MKFIVDAQLPVRLTKWMVAQNFDAIHTDEIAIETGREPTDSEISEIANAENRIVISKDRDFLKAHLLIGKPSKLLFVATGNISNPNLLELFEKNFGIALKLLDSFDLVEMNNLFVIGRGK